MEEDGFTSSCGDESENVFLSHRRFYDVLLMLSEGGVTESIEKQFF
jgi:outer membrane protein OmpA-like peptidoglycan-associated protein